MKIYFFSLFFIYLLILPGCYVGEDPIPTDEPSPKPTPLAWNNETKLTAFDGEEGDGFGCSVGISGDYAVVGAYFDYTTETNTGSAYIFTKNESLWTMYDKIVANDSGDSKYFGNSVSISGDYIIVCNMIDESAYLFHREGTVWTEQQKLLATDGAVWFGYSVDISDDYAFIGARYDTDNGSASGSAYIFFREGTTWTEQQKILPVDGAIDDQFGFSVSISGDYALIGAYLNDDYGTNSGSAYIFKRDGTPWIEQQKLLANDGAPDDQFGYSVSISGNYALIGAPYNEDIGYNTGAAYIFVRDGNTWTEQQKLTAQDGGSNDSFEISVDISGDHVIIGALDDYNGTNSGSAYIFTRDETSWIEQRKLTASDGERDNNFGRSVCISGDSIIVGANTDDDNGNNSGSAYIFE